MKPIRFCVLMAATLLLGACSGASFKDWHPDEVAALPQQGNEFQQALHRHYAAREELENDEYHSNATSYFDAKARQAAAGKEVLPTRMNERSISAPYVGALTDARARLMNLLSNGGPRVAPAQTGHAQVMFDCWMEEQEEGHQAADIAYCRNGFEASLAEANSLVLASIPMPAPQRAAVTEAPANPDPTPITLFTVYFDHNSSKLDGAATLLSEQIIDQINANRTRTVMVNGYTDRSGGHEYNRKLAERRAAAVVSVFKSAGIVAVINFESFGEDRPAILTGDSVREPRNRRVVVTLQ